MVLDALVDLGRGPELRPEPLDLGQLAISPRRRSGRRWPRAAAKASSRSPSRARTLAWSKSSRRSGRGRAGVCDGTGRPGPGRASACQRSSQRSTRSRGSRPAHSRMSPARSVGEEVVERLADGAEAELDGQLDEVGVAGGQPLAEGGGEGLVADGQRRSARRGRRSRGRPRPRSAWRRRTSPQNEWNVRSGPPPGPGARPPAGRVAAPRRAGRGTRRRIRSRSSRAALFGERQRHDPAQRPRLRRLEGPEEPLGEHRRLAATRPGAQGHARPGDAQARAARSVSGGDRPGGRSWLALQRRPVGPDLARRRRTSADPADGVVVAELRAVLLLRVDREAPRRSCRPARPRRPSAARVGRPVLDLHALTRPSAGSSSHVVGPSSPSGR